MVSEMYPSRFCFTYLSAPFRSTAPRKPPQSQRRASKFRCPMAWLMMRFWRSSMSGFSASPSTKLMAIRASCSRRLRLMM